MKPEVFEVVKLVLQIMLVVLAYFVYPTFKKWLDSNTSAEQRKEWKFWTQLAIKWAEDLYNQRGQGALKEEEVVKYLKEIGITIEEAQMRILIRMIVEQYNKNGWNKLLD